MWVAKEMKIKSKDKRCFRCGILLEPLPHIGASHCKKCFMGWKK